MNQGKEGHLFSKIAELKAKIAELENDVEVLQERSDEFLEIPGVHKTFQNGKYTDEIRSVYEDLLCWGVGVDNVVNVVWVALENLSGLQCVYACLKLLLPDACILRQGDWHKIRSQKKF